MPVLDAKALDIDPKGMAFLLSVLRPTPLGAVTDPKEAAPTRRLPPSVRMHFRLSARMKQFMPDLV